MTRPMLLTVLLALLAPACERAQSPLPRIHDAPQHVSAASYITTVYAKSRMAPWKIRARAAGADCSVLFVQTDTVMEQSMVEALHYGAGTYAIYRGGLQQFCRERAFRGAIYRDTTNMVWRFGIVSPQESEKPVFCD